MTGEFHSRAGFYFQRQEDGSVRVRVAESGQADAATLREVTLPPAEWASAVASVSGRGETFETWNETLHNHQEAGP